MTTRIRTSPLSGPQWGLFSLALLTPLAERAQAACLPGTPRNPIEAENCQTGATDWDISGAGDSRLQGFATDISVNQGGTVHFKVDSPNATYQIVIYRLGYYSATGARKITTLGPFQSTNQPACLTQASTGLVDCGNWGETASWTVPAGSASGIYIAKLVRANNSGASHIAFVVRDDSRASDILFQTSDTTWQAYNDYGGNSFYHGTGPGKGGASNGRAYKLSYNRPFVTRSVDNGQDWLFNAEYPMVRWLEANGYDVSYATGVDTDRDANLLLNHKVFLSVGHDEYWSGAQRANVEAARGQGVNLAFFSGNELFWKTRWETSIDGSGTPYRTLVCYKETHQFPDNRDPADPPTWTGTWRDPRNSPPADGGRPENALLGTLFTVNAGATSSIQVPEADGKMRLWRNTNIANLAVGQTATLPNGTLGYEWDEDVDNGARPPGLFRNSTTVVDPAPVLTDFGSTFGSGKANHALTLYRHNSGALVFGAGTVQWSWGLDSQHDRSGTPVDTRMRQATVNLLADMGVQPVTLQSGLTAATPSVDALPPSSAITFPTQSTALVAGNPVTITGTAADTGGGRVGGVEVSTDGGATWHPAIGRAAWSYDWTPANSTATLRSRAVDDSGNLETPGAGVTVGIGGIGGGTPGQACASHCTLFTATAVPATPDGGRDNPVEIGVRFRSDVAGSITGVRFYKVTANTGTHVANLWNASGARLAQATFTGESASGWQQVNFSSPVPIDANTVYTASYHAPIGHYSADQNGFGAAKDNAPLHALANAAGSPNGVYAYGAASVFPTQNWNGSNYWVDVVFEPGNTAPAPLAVTTTAVPGATANTAYSTTLSANGGTSPYTWSLSGGALPTGFTLASNGTLSGTTSATGPFTFTAQVKDSASPAQTVSQALSLTVSAQATASGASLFGTATPAQAVQDSDTGAVELGVKFTPAANGRITGVRFYKTTGNTGTHTGSLWSAAGASLAKATFSGETASGWQQVTFATPVSVTAGTTYVASYFAPAGHYAATTGFFASGYANAPLSTPANAGVYVYGSGGGFPSSSYQNSNYWVDVLFSSP